VNSQPSRDISRLEPATTHWFAAEVQPHEPALREWLRTRFPWLSDVDNVAREAVVKLWHKQKSAGSKTLRSPKAMLFAIARNAAYDEGRRRGVAKMTSVAEIEQLFVLDENANVAETVSTRQELEVLAEAVRRLPDGCRQVLTLCKMYGMSPKEAAQQLGISEHTVRAQIAKGIRRCAEYLRHRGVNGNNHEAG
jgi:RNA polymerase sigma-70 factor (ECF subfamily)